LGTESDWARVCYTLGVVRWLDRRWRGFPRLLTGPQVILALKVAVATVTLIFLTSLVALARGNYRLHGRINLAFFTLTLAALLALEGLIRILDPRIFEYIHAHDALREALVVHLCFAVPSA